MFINVQQKYLKLYNTIYYRSSFMHCATYSYHNIKSLYNTYIAYTTACTYIAVISSNTTACTYITVISSNTTAAIKS